MPHITVRGFSKEDLTKLAKPLKSAFVEATGINAEYVKIFYSSICRVDEAEETAVDVYWMHRPQELCDLAAETITAFMRQQGKEFVQVTFTEFPGEHFYENNVHY